MFAGVDTHKDTLAVAVVDAAAGVVAGAVVANDGQGFAALVELLSVHRVRRVGIEGSGTYGRALAVHLVDRLGSQPVAGAARGVLEVVEVLPSMTFRERGRRPGQGKSDPVDAVAIARIVARERHLPPVRLTVGAAADLRALLGYRDELVRERTAVANRVHMELTALRPGYQHQVAHLTGPAQLDAARALLDGDGGVRAELTRSRLTRLGELDTQISALRRRVAAAVTACGTGLVDICGVGPLVAGRIIAEVGDIARYPSRDAFAAGNGTAPIPASSGRTTRHRLNRGGNRALNRALYTVALTEIAHPGPGRAYYLRKRAEGKTSREALRCLKRRLSDIVYRTLRQDLTAAASRPSAPARQGGQGGAPEGPKARRRNDLDRPKRRRTLQAAAADPPPPTPTDPTHRHDGRPRGGVAVANGRD